MLYDETAAADEGNHLTGACEPGFVDPTAAEPALVLAVRPLGAPSPPISCQKKVEKKLATNALSDPPPMARKRDIYFVRSREDFSDEMRSIDRAISALYFCIFRTFTVGVRKASLDYFAM